MSQLHLHKSTTNSNKYHRFDNILCKIPLSGPSFRTLKEPTTVFKRTVGLKNIRALGSTKTRIIQGRDDRCISSTVSTFEQKALIDNGGASFHQTLTASQLHTLVNNVSKWIVAVSFSAFIMLRHDGVALWAAMGCVWNFILSITLKQILKQERPLSEVSSGPGMPSSHAQSIFFTLVFMILSVVETMGLNGVTVVLGIVFIALGLYFSWLRVLLHYHTTSQVVVGTIVGSVFSVLWFWAWEAFIHMVYISSLWVQILLIVGAACYCLAFISYVGWHLVKD